MSEPPSQYCYDESNRGVVLDTYAPKLQQEEVSFESLQEKAEEILFMNEHMEEHRQAT